MEAGALVPVEVQVLSPRPQEYMTGKEFQKVQNRVECEGFEYTFINYSNFDEIQDEEFHKLRTAYKDAYKNLSDYLGIDS